MHATERPKNTGKTMRRTMAFILKHYKWHCLAVVICIVLTVLAQLNGTLFLQKLYDSYLSPMLESGSTDFTPLLHKLIQVGAVYAIGVLCSWGYTRLMVNVFAGHDAQLPRKASSAIWRACPSRISTRFPRRHHVRLHERYRHAPPVHRPESAAAVFPASSAS